MNAPEIAIAAAPSTRIDRIVTPAGIEAWLVEDYTVPILSMDFAFIGGGALDSLDKSGLSLMMANLCDEGAGPYKAQAFQERLDDLAVELSFSSNRDRFEGSMRTLARNADEAFAMLELAVMKPRFDADAVTRVRAQITASLKRAESDPDSLVWKAYQSRSFAGHPYGRPDKGTVQTIAGLTRDDLVACHASRMSKATLKVAVVGAVNPGQLALCLDRVFGALPASVAHEAIADTVPGGLGARAVVPLKVPQSTLAMGRPGLGRKDPDFMAAYVVNHILGGGSFTSRLWTEVREKRGLAYSVWSQMSTARHAASLLAGTATSNERVAESLAIIETEIRRMAEYGPTQEELNKALKYLIGSYALRFDTSRKIASHLVEIQVEDLGIDYIATRNQRMGEVSLDDARRAAGRLIGDGQMLVAVVGQPEGITAEG